MTARAASFFTGHHLRPRQFFPLLWHSACDMPGMVLKITKKTAGTVTVIRIAGELTREGVAELESPKLKLTKHAWSQLVTGEKRFANLHASLKAFDIAIGH